MSTTKRPTKPPKSEKPKACWSCHEICKVPQGQQSQCLSCRVNDSRKFCHVCEPDQLLGCSACHEKFCTICNVDEGEPHMTRHTETWSGPCEDAHHVGANVRMCSDCARSDCNGCGALICRGCFQSSTDLCRECVTAAANELKKFDAKVKRKNVVPEEKNKRKKVSGKEKK